MFFGPYIANCQDVVNFLADTIYWKNMKWKSNFICENLK